MRKITIEIPEEDYITIVNSLHHGQLSALTRLFMENIAAKFTSKTKVDVMNWLYGKKSLTLKPSGSLKHE